MKKNKPLDFKKVLNPSQLDAVQTIDGPVLVVAGAGTGKTRVIEYRCLNMVNMGIAPEQILLLTFTRKAARQMLSRASLHDAKCRKIHGGTFHSFAYHVIKKHKRDLGFENNISFMDEGDCADALNLLASRLGYLEDKSRFPKKDTLRKILSMSLNRNKSIYEVLKTDYPHFLQLNENFETLRKKFTEYKLSRNLIDYDDMLIYLKFLLDNESINKDIQARYKYVMVDEFQDTNKIQAEIIYSLARNHGNCMAVGDDTQSIYSFRGAYYKNMFDFPVRFPDTRIIKLEYNYRSTQPILDVANAIIQGEAQKYTKVLFTTCQGEDQPTLSFFKDSFSESDWVASRIKEYRDRGVSLDSIGVLYRSNFHSLTVQMALSRLNIPFVVYGGIKFIETAHIKDCLAFLKVAHNARDEISFARVLMLLDGVGPKTAEKIKDAIASFDDEKKNEILKKNFKSDVLIKEIISLLDLFKKINEAKDVEKKIKKIINYYTPILKKKFDDYPSRQEDLRAFMEISSSYSSLEQFLVDFVTIETPERSTYEVEACVKDEPPVVLSTIHSAKGLEWTVVFIISLVDGALPVSYALDSSEGIEEERRLFYVAVTRAKRFLHLSMHNEGRNGGMNSLNKLSRFVSEPAVMDKLRADSVYLDEEDYAQQDVSRHCGSKEGLYRKLVDYFDNNSFDEYF